MRLFLKIVVYCIILVFASTSNLKHSSTLTGKQIYSNFITVSNLNKTKKLTASKKQAPESEIKWNYYNILFSEVGDKTFICITLLFYQTKTAYLILTSIFTKLIFIYLKVLMAQYSLAQFIPSEIFQVFGIIIYNITGFTIFYKLMFVNLIDFSRKDIKPKINEEMENTFTFDFEAFIKVFGIVFISQLAAYSINEHNLLYIYNASGNVDKSSFLSWHYLVINLASILFGILFSVIIGFITFKKFSLEFNLIISAITFLLLGIDNSVKFFSVNNEWNI